MRSTEHEGAGGYPDEEPSAEDLAAIEEEWPVIEAEVRLLDAEIAVIRAGRARASAMDWQRVRAAEREVVSAWLAYVAAYLGAGKAVA